MNKYELKIHHEDNNFIRYCYSEYNLKENSLVKLNDGTYGTILRQSNMDKIDRCLDIPEKKIVKKVIAIQQDFCNNFRSITLFESIIFNNIFQNDMIKDVTINFGNLKKTELINIFGDPDRGTIYTLSEILNETLKKDIVICMNGSNILCFSKKPFSTSSLKIEDIFITILLNNLDGFSEHKPKQKPDIDIRGCYPDALNHKETNKNLL